MFQGVVEFKFWVFFFVIRFKFVFYTWQSFIVNLFLNSIMGFQIKNIQSSNQNLNNQTSTSDVPNYTKISPSLWYENVIKIFLNEEKKALSLIKAMVAKIWVFGSRTKKKQESLFPSGGWIFTVMSKALILMANLSSVRFG